MRNITVSTTMSAAGIVSFRFYDIAYFRRNLMLVSSLKKTKPAVWILLLRRRLSENVKIVTRAVILSVVLYGFEM